MGLNVLLDCGMEYRNEQPKSIARAQHVHLDCRALAAMTTKTVLVIQEVTFVVEWLTRLLKFERNVMELFLKLCIGSKQLLYTPTSLSTNTCSVNCVHGLT